MRIQILGTEITNSRSINNTQPNNIEVRKTIRVGASRNNQNQQYDLDLKADELVEFQFEKGVIWITAPNKIPSLFGKMRSSGDIFLIPTSITLDRDGAVQTRGLFNNIALEVVRIFAPKITEPIINKAVAKIEQQLLPNEGLNFVTDTFGLSPYATSGEKLAPKKPILLFLHGTVSNTLGSFGELQISKTWIALRRRFEQNILAFDHKTLSKSPFENALDLLEKLPKDSKLHLVSHSRGGLIGEILVRCSQKGLAFSKKEISTLEKLNVPILTKFIETVKELPTAAAESIFSQSGLKNFTQETIKNWDKIDLKTAARLLVKINDIDWKKMSLQPFFDTARESTLSNFFEQLDQPNRQKDADTLKQLNQLAKAKNIRVEKFVRTACPANGTSILGENTDLILNVLLNLTLFASGQVVNPAAQTIKSLIISIVKQRNNPRVLPGLECMIKETPLLKILNDTDKKIAGDLTIIAGKTGGDKFFKIVKHFFIDQVFQAKNDLVVDTKSMFGGMPRTNPVYYKFVTGHEVGHCSYFGNVATQVAIYHALISNHGYFDLFESIDSLEPKLRSRGVMSRDTIAADPAPIDADAVDTPRLQVSVKNGHLKYANYPVVIGHFKNDIITSAESVMDSLLDYSLSRHHEVGDYPGEVDSRPLISIDAHEQPNAVIIGLGNPEEFTPYQLNQSIEKGVTAYLLDLHKKQPVPSQQEIGLSILLIGTNYIHISIGDALNAILEGIVSANKKMDLVLEDTDLPKVTNIEFIEIYEDKSIRAYHHLSSIIAGNNSYNIELKKGINKTNSRRTFRPISVEKAWWKRLTAQMRIDPKTKEKSLYFNAASQRAAVSERHSYANQRNIKSLLEEQSQQTNWDKKLMKTIFDLVVPNDLKLNFRSQQNLLLLLDKYTASYPWELMHYDENARKPICVTAGMIRQLATTYDQKIQDIISDNKVLIIGDPQLDLESSIPQLPAARREAELVDLLFNQQAETFETTRSIQENSTEIIKALFSNYKVIHIASHGVVNYQSTAFPDESPRTGLLLSNDFVLTTAEIEKMDTVPELVFINSCYAGKIDHDQETLSRSRYNLAANIGTHFIEQGAKVVVVAGWAINDDAAFRFAEDFYNKMLAGQTFADAILAARTNCYDNFKHTNTWGAYQCYGDQNYRLVKPNQQKTEDKEYKDQIDILADLERTINDAKSSKERADEHFSAALAKISEAIPDNLKNARTLELEAEAYAEILDYENAIAKYQSLWSEKDALFSFRSIEQSLSLTARHIAKQYKNTIAPKKVLAILDTVIKDLKYFIKKGATAERYNILASVYRRKAMIAPMKDKQALIQQTALQYLNAYEHTERTEIYPLSNWLISERFLIPQTPIKKTDLKAVKEEKERAERIKKYIEDPISTFLEKELKKPKITKAKDFWGLISRVNIYQCQLLYCQTKDLPKVVTNIKEQYLKAWKIDGSYRQKASEIDQMEFIKNAVVIFLPKQTKLLAACDELLDFFEKLV